MGASNSSAKKSVAVAEQQYNLAVKQREEAQAMANAKKTNALYSFQGKTSRVGFGDIGAVKKRTGEGGSDSGMRTGFSSLGVSTLGLLDTNRNKLGG